MRDTAGPEGVRLLMSDGTRVPCRCRFIGRDKDGLDVWVAEPVEPRAFEGPIKVEVDVMPGESALIFDIALVPH